jgi:hypothetical protein
MGQLKTEEKNYSLFGLHDSQKNNLQKCTNFTIFPK